MLLTVFGDQKESETEELHVKRYKSQEMFVMRVSLREWNFEAREW